MPTRIRLELAPEVLRRCSFCDVFPFVLWQIFDERAAPAWIPASDDPC